MNTNLRIIFTLLLLSTISLCAKCNSTRIVSYNCENMFDTIHCEGKEDVAFTPTGSMQWTSKKFKTKMRNIARVISTVGEWGKPALFGLLEVENDYVLHYLTERTQIATQNYKFIHHESNDERGIDVALLYDTAQVSIVSKEFINVDVPDKATREILYAECLLRNGDTIHLFINHWPSRYGGELVSIPRRMNAARKLRSKVDSIFAKNIEANIVIMGDFNDYPNNESIRNTLNAKPLDAKTESGELYNLMYKFFEEKNVGTHYYQREWGVLDQIIVSSGMLNSKSKTHTSQEKAGIFKADFMLEKNAVNEKVPRRSFKGTYFLKSGYSDHLPVYLDIEW